MDADERREIISQTVDNLISIYGDINEIVQMIDEQMKNSGFHSAFGNKLVWETTNTIGCPDQWLSRWFARFYPHPDDSTTGVGYCIHLGGYEKEEIELMPPLPVVNITWLRMDGDISSLGMKDVYNILWGAGWEEQGDGRGQRKVSCEFLVKDVLDWDDHPGESLSYFVDPLKLINGNIIKQGIVDPMIEMVKGNQGFIPNAETLVRDILERPIGK